MTVIECSRNENFCCYWRKNFLSRISGSIDSLEVFFGLFVCYAAAYFCCRSNNKFHHQQKFYHTAFAISSINFFSLYIFKLRNNNEPQESYYTAQVYINIDFFDIDLLFNLFRYIMKCRCCCFAFLRWGTFFYDLL